MVVVGVLSPEEPVITKAGTNLAHMLTIQDSLVILPDRAVESLVRSDLMGAFDALPQKVTWLGRIPDEYRKDLLLLPVVDAVEAATHLYRLNAAPLHLATSILILLTALGLAGVTLSSLEQRIREFGIRVALGATPFQVMAQIIVEAIFVASLGGAVGALLGAWLAEQVPGGPRGPVWSAMFFVWTGMTLLGGLVVLYPARAFGRLKVDTAIRNG
jgi:hypothetical protein